ncbi:hypothetical protein FRB96_000600 [Tulasnella sp. 330]|nr:hypothetical protein FRB96_000600 [Tulasnella sp. 330]
MPLPLLYSRVILTPKSLVSFCNAIKVGTNKPSYNYIDKAKLMKSLALVGWDRNEDELDGEDRRRVRQIIDATKLSLVRLFSDISFTTLYEVLRTCSVIEEMCIAERAARGGRIPLIPQTLKRMAVVGATINDELLNDIGCCKVLNMCVVAWPYGVQVQTFAALTKGAFGLGRRQELVIVLEEEDSGLVERLEKYGRGAWTPRPSEIVEIGAFTVMEAGTASHEDARMAWFTQSTLDGSIWDRHRETWDDYRDLQNGGRATQADGICPTSLPGRFLSRPRVVKS